MVRYCTYMYMIQFVDHLYQHIIYIVLRIYTNLNKFSIDNDYWLSHCHWLMPIDAETCQRVKQVIVYPRPLGVNFVLLWFQFLFTLISKKNHSDSIKTENSNKERLQLVFAATGLSIFNQFKRTAPNAPNQCNVCEVRLQHKIMVWLHFPPNADSHKRFRLQVPPCSLPGNPTDFKALPGNRPNWLLASFCKTPDWTSSSGFIKSSSKKSPQIPLLWTRPLSLAFGPSGRLVSPKIQKNPENTLSCDGSLTLPKNSKFSSYPYLHLHDYAVHVHVDHHRLDPEDISPPDTMSYSKPEQMSDQEFYISVEQVSEHQTKIS